MELVHIRELLEQGFYLFMFISFDWFNKHGKIYLYAHLCEEVKYLENY
jgi:hypothetical protein